MFKDKSDLFICPECHCLSPLDERGYIWCGDCCCLWFPCQRVGCDNYVMSGSYVSKYDGSPYTKVLCSNCTESLESNPYMSMGPDECCFIHGDLCDSWESCREYMLPATLNREVIDHMGDLYVIYKIKKE